MITSYSIIIRLFLPRLVKVSVMILHVAVDRNLPKYDAVSFGSSMATIRQSILKS